MHPVLLIVTTESNKCDARLGITWAARVPAGRSGKLRVQVCVDCTFSPFGRQAMTATLASKICWWLLHQLLRSGSLLWSKGWPIV